MLLLTINFTNLSLVWADAVTMELVYRLSSSIYTFVWTYTKLHLLIHRLRGWVKTQNKKINILLLLTSFLTSTLPFSLSRRRGYLSLWLITYFSVKKLSFIVLLSTSLSLFLRREMRVRFFINPQINLWGNIITQFISN